TGFDVDGDALTFSIVALPEDGVLTGSGSNRIYSPTTNFYGQDHFTFKANDGQVDSGEEIITVNVLPANDLPEAYGQSVTVRRGQPAVITLSGFDIDGDVLSYKILSLPAHGTLTGSGEKWSYQSAAGFSGADNFTFAVNDGTVDSSPATVILTVSANEAPVARIVISPLV